eukprot:Lankesteria_metandrocarpae@DN3109_c1_g1_i2.p1
MRLDFVVQSTDKNFMVPVGGSVVASPHTHLIEGLSESYPGRASASPTIDLLLTLLQMGADEFTARRDERCLLAVWFASELRKRAVEWGHRLLETPKNTISFAVCLTGVTELPGVAEHWDTGGSLPAVEAHNKTLTGIGSSLYHKRCSGARVVLSSSVHDMNPRSVGQQTFRNYGSHADFYPHSYLTLAVAIGASRKELETVLQKTEAILKDLKNR